MKIQSQNAICNSAQQPSYKGLHVVNPYVQQFLLTSLKSKQLEELALLIKEQQNNSVHILLDSKDGKLLKASLISDYRIKDFKQKYKQFPIFESKIHFIKRVVNIANNYKQQVKDFEVMKLNWKYSLLKEWKTKMHL